MSQGINAIAIGVNAGSEYQGTNTIAIGINAGYSRQQLSAIAIGNNAGQISQGSGSIAIGYYAGNTLQDQKSIAIGYNAGYWRQLTNSIAIGTTAGQTNQGSDAIAIGNKSGLVSQGSSTIAIGYASGTTGQKQNAIAIGWGAGSSGQGAYAIAIGYQAGFNGQVAGSIVINATSTKQINPATVGFFASPIRGRAQASYNGTTYGGVYYDTANNEILYNVATTKTFVIDHPLNDKKYLVHACLEGPESGVYYRGKCEITNSEFVEINLPDYVEKLATDLTVQITHIYDGSVKTYSASEVVNNRFTVHGENGKFYWIVHGKRASVDVEPLKATTNVKGTGPYRWI
jgi:hypothetical protein